MAQPVFETKTIIAEKVIAQKLGISNKSGEITAEISGEGGLKMYDKNGRTRVVLTLIGDETPVLLLCDAQGNKRVVLGVTDDMSSFIIQDSNELPRASIILNSNELVSYKLYDRKGILRSDISCNEEVGPSVCLYDSDADLRMAIHLTDDNPQVAIIDKSQNPISTLP